MPKFDAVILGAGLSGCAVAAMMAKAGKRVLIMDPGSAVGGNSSSVDLQDDRILGWPVCSYGFEDGGAWFSVFRDLGLQSPVAQQNAAYQVALPDRRITVAPEASATLAELGREYPGEIDALKRFYQELASLGTRLSRNRISSYLARRRKATDLMRSYRFSKELMAFFSASSLVFLGIPIHEASVAQLVALVTKPPRLLSGGVDALARELCEFVTNRGGECRLNEPWPELLVRRSKLEGIRTADERVDVRTAVLNMPWRDRHQTLFSLVREEGLPVGMLDTVIVVDDYDHPRLSMMLSLDPQIPGTPSDRGVRPMRALFPGNGEPDETPENLMRAVSRIVPFLADFTEVTSFRDSSDRALPAGNSAVLTQRPARSIGTLPLLQLPVRAIYVLEDTPFGMVHQAKAALALASRLS